MMAFVACNKVEMNNGETTPVENKGAATYELFASVDALTKATISESSGAFSWKTGTTDGDVIAVKTSTNHVYAFRAVEIVNDIARFVCNEAIDGNPSTAVFPYTADATCALPTSVTCTSALGDDIRLTGKISGKNIAFQHAAALVKVNFTNVPIFADKIVFDGNKNDVDVTVSLGARGDVVAYIPVDPSTTSFTISIEDDNNHTILSKSASSKTFTTGSLMKMASLDVTGTVFVFDDPKDKIDEARFFKSDGNTTIYSTYSNLTLNTLSDGTKWCIVNNSSLGNIVELQTWKNNDYVSETKSLFLYRDFNITIPDDGKGIKTNYRTYFYLNADNCQNNWGSTTYIGVKQHSSSSWSWTTMTKSGDYLFYYENDTANYGESMDYAFNNGNGWIAKDESDPWNYTLNREYQWNCNL